MNDIEQTVITIRDAIKNYPTKYTDNLDRIKKIEFEIQDLLHLIEFTKFNASDGYKITKRIQELRKERRILKDENEQLNHVHPILKIWRDRLHQLDNAIGNIRKTKSNNSKRRYRCRVRKDLENKINNERCGSS